MNLMSLCASSTIFDPFVSTTNQWTKYDSLRLKYSTILTHSYLPCIIWTWYDSLYHICFFCHLTCLIWTYFDSLCSILFFCYLKCFIWTWYDPLHHIWLFLSLACFICISGAPHSALSDSLFFIIWFGIHSLCHMQKPCRKDAVCLPIHSALSHSLRLALRRCT